jgi:hypothetical protein
MKKIILSFICLFVIHSSLYAENLNDDLISKKNGPKENPFVSKAPYKRVFAGGDIGASFGDYTEVRVSPLIGYRISNYVSTGLKFIYIHSWEQISQNTTSATTLQSNTIGGNIFLTYYPVSSFYLTTEFEYDWYKNYSTTQNTSAATNGVPFLYLGLGYSRPISQFATFNLGIKADVLNNANSPYPDFAPIFDVGINVGI